MYSRKCLLAFVVFIAVTYSQAQDLRFDGYWVGTLQLEKMPPDELQLQVNGESGLLKIIDAGTKSIIWGNAKVERKADMVTVAYDGSTDFKPMQGAVITGSFSGKWTGGDTWEGNTTVAINETKMRGQFRLKRADGEIVGRPSQVAENEETLRARLKSRYDGKVVVTMVNGLSAGEFQKGAIAGVGVGRGDADVFWYHWHESVRIPDRVEGGAFGKKLAELDRLDSRTYGHLLGGIRNVIPIAKSDPLRIYKFYARGDTVELILTPTRMSQRGQLDPLKQNKELSEVGFSFKFFFDRQSVMKSGDYKTVIAEIGKYLVPEAEAAEVSQSAKTIELNIGAAEEDVRKQLGEPTRIIKVGKQTFLKYPDMTITIEDGKVINIKVE